MKVIGVRELKNKLSEYICRVRLGSLSERGLLMKLEFASPSSLPELQL